MIDKIKVVVADDNEITRQMIVDSLEDDSQIEVVGQASNGTDAIKLIKENRPDVVLLDLVMPMADGIGVMEAISDDETFSQKKPQYIVISAAGSEDIVNQALQTGAAYFIMKPFDGEALVKRVKRMCNGSDSVRYTTYEREEQEPDVEQMIVLLLRDLGVSVRMVGYKYLREAIYLAINDADSLTSVTKYIYPEIASRHGTSSSNVERNIRYVIESAWSRRSEEKYKAIQDKMFIDKEKKPTNSEFIMSCSEEIIYQIKK